MTLDIKILLVDDHSDLRLVLTEQLAVEGFLVEEAENAEQALHKLNHNTYDVLLLDINLPDGSGFDVLKFINDHNIKCKVIILTVASGLNIAIHSMRLGASDCISKPFNLDYLVVSIHRALNHPLDISSA